MTRLQEIPWVDEGLDSAVFHKPDGKKALVNRLDLYQVSWLRILLESRWPQFILRLITLLGFMFTIITAISGTQVGSHNFAIIMVWIGWWTVLKLGFIPLGGRSWCSICPIPLPGEWLQQGGILEKAERKTGLNLRWPKRLRGSWLQSGGFLAIGLFSAVTLTDPHVTGWVLLVLFLLATGLSLIFEHRAFCSYLCPIGGFSGMYAKAAAVELRVVDRSVCARHGDKSCYQACPWGLYPLALKDSSACGLCLECLRACPKDNLALSMRPYGGDLLQAKNSHRIDEAFLALVMLGSVLVFSAVFLGPWGGLKSAAYTIGSRAWMAYAIFFLAFTSLILPGLYTGSVWVWQKISQSSHSLRQLIARHAYSLIPLGLLAWIAFTISFALPKLNLVLGVLNDPFGWGWNWLHFTGASQSLDVSAFSPYFQGILVLAGAFWSASITQKTSKLDGKRVMVPNIPLLVFTLLFSAALLWLLLG